MAKVKKEYKDMTDEEKFDHDLKQFHKNSDRHVWHPEAQMSYQDRVAIYSLAEKLRKMGNELTGIMEKNYGQLVRTKRYRKLGELYGKCKKELDKAKADLEKLKKNNKPDEDEINKLTKMVKKLDDKRKDLANQISEMQQQYNVTWHFCYKQMDYINKKYGAHAHFARSVAEDVWFGVAACLYGNGTKLHFAKRNELSAIEAKEITRGITVKSDDGVLKFSISGSSFGKKNAKKMTFEVNLKDKFDQDEHDAIVNYLNNAKAIDEKAVNNYRNGIIDDTYRPCYVSLVCKTILGKLRVYVHITVEGKAKPKYNYNKQTKGYERRHRYGVGIVSNDIGTQSVAYTSAPEVGLKNLAERGRSIVENERKERILKRAMDRSQRNMNPDNYNEDGAIKKGKKTWIKSKYQIEREEAYRELCRINAENRHLAIRELGHHLRSLGDVMITEPKNAKQLQQKVEVANETTGQIERHKNHGHAIQNRCPGYHQEFIKFLFESTGGKYIEVPPDFRASQYDHTNDTYTKKDLNVRMFTLSDGTEVQRDWYSSFLMYCADLSDPNHIKIDREKCFREFPKMYAKYLAMVEVLKTLGIHVMNSGIK